MLRLELARLPEEHFRDDCEELGGSCGCVGIEQRRQACSQSRAHAVIFLPEHMRPFLMCGARAEPGRAIHRLIFHVEIVRELVQDHVVTGMR